MDIDGWWNHAGMIVKVTQGKGVAQAAFGRCAKDDIVLQVEQWDGTRFTGRGKAWADGVEYDIVGSVQSGPQKSVNISWPTFGTTVMLPHV